MEHDPGFTTARTVFMALGQSLNKFPSQNVKVSYILYLER